MFLICQYGDVCNPVWLWVQARLKRIYFIFFKFKFIFAHISIVKKLEYEIFDCENIVRGGDFNIHMNSKLDAVNIKTKIENIDYKEKLKAFIDVNNLIDIYM